MEVFLLLLDELDDAFAMVRLRAAALLPGRRRPYAGR